MKNYLFSGNITDEAKKLLKQDLVGAKVLVGIAAGNDYDKGEMYFYQGNEKYSSTVSDFKDISNITEFKLLDGRTTGKDAQEILTSADVIYLSGGDPFVQLKYIKDNGLDIILNSFDGLVVGVSAGSMNQGKIVYYCKDEDFPETTIYNGLGLVDVTIDPHYDITNDEQVSEHTKWSEQIPIIGLPNDSFIVVDNGIVNIYGDSYQIAQKKK